MTATLNSRVTRTAPAIDSPSWARSSENVGYRIFYTEEGLPATMVYEDDWEQPRIFINLPNGQPTGEEPISLGEALALAEHLLKLVALAHATPNGALVIHPVCRTLVAEGRANQERPTGGPASREQLY